MWRVKRVAGAVKSFLWQNWLPDWRRWCQWREILSVGEEGILSRIQLDWGRKMPSLTGQVNMWGANNEHHHVCPHVRAGLKPGLPSKKILEQKHVRCPPVLIQACHRRLISPKLISLVDGQTEIRKKKEIEVWKDGGEQSTKVQGQNRAAQPKAGRVDRTVWGEKLRQFYLKLIVKLIYWRYGYGYDMMYQHLN